MSLWVLGHLGSADDLCKAARLPDFPQVWKNPKLPPGDTWGEYRLSYHSLRFPRDSILVELKRQGMFICFCFYSAHDRSEALT